MMQFHTLNVTTKDETCFIQINRPHIANKLSIQCMDELRAALDYALSLFCSSVVLSGLPDIFCSGGELGDFRAKSISEIKSFGAAFIALHLAICACPLPVIAAVEGDALGGGFSLVEACDLAVAAESAQFAIPEIIDGLAPAMGLSGIYANLTKKQVMGLGILGERLSAAKALELGMLNVVVPKDRVMVEAVRMANFFRTANPTALRLFKELYADMGKHAYEDRLNMGRSMMIELFKSKNGAEVLTSKEESRAPVWCME